jgi:hypothetical protein
MWFLPLIQALILAFVIAAGCPLWAVIFVACNFAICLALAVNS